MQTNSTYFSFLYVNDIWNYIVSAIGPFADDCVIYRKITNKEYMEMLQKFGDRLGVWAVENAMKINPSKSKALHFTRARVKYPLNYSLMYTIIPEASSDFSGRIKSSTRCKWPGKHYISLCEN
jgi:hypothetical protein